MGGDLLRLLLLLLVVKTKTKTLPPPAQGNSGGTIVIDGVASDQRSDTPQGWVG